jgi:Uma2 family endonuclease
MVTTRFLTADDLFQLGPDAPYVLLEGELVGVNPPGGIHGEVAGKMSAYLGMFILTNKLGEFFTHDAGFVLQQNPDTVFGPDFAFIRRGRLTKSPQAYIRMAPDLAVEVVSPSNTRPEVDRKTRIYLDAGVEQVWIVDPFRGELSVRQADAPTVVLGPEDIISGKNLLPGFELRVGDLFDEG